MESSFLAPPAKRTIHNLQGMNPNLNPSFSNGVSGGGASKRGRSKPPMPPLSVLPGQAAFRLLCHSSRVGGVIGKSGTIVKQLQADTGAKIRVEESPPGSEERVVVVIGSSSVDKKVTLDGGGEEEVFEVSTAQEAAFRVFERVLDVAADANGSGGPEGVVSCRLLAEAGRAGSVIGKGGKIVEQIRKETGCKIRVFSSDKLPACAYPNDEMIEIEGETLGVKKALLSVSRRLQDSQASDKPAKISGSRPYEAAVPYESRPYEAAVPYESLPGPRDHYPPHSFVRPPPPPIPSSSISYGSGGRTSSQQDVVFKILCSHDRVGGVIGKSGTIIRALQNETGASICVGASLPECNERLITVTASENLESKYSPAQNAAILVFTRSIETGFENRLESWSDGSPVSARLVVPSNQVGCLLGKGGSVISEMRQLTGTGIKILGSDQVPKCASETDSVVQISGEFPNVQEAVYRVTRKLRDNLSPNQLTNGTGTWSGSAPVSEIGSYGRAGDPSPGLYSSYGASHGFNRHTALTQSMDHLGLSRSYDRPLSPISWPSQSILNPRSGMDGRGFTAFKAGLELGSGNKSAIVTNATVEIVVPENVIGSVFGENGSNLTRLRQISGAKVVVHEPHLGTSERRVVISGTPDETQAAQSLLQAFILTGSS